jgi:hypothetical protein
MREQIFDPLGMRDTIPDPAAVEADDDFPLVNLNTGADLRSAGDARYHP